MIEDARVLQEEFIPEEIQHRNAETNQLSNALEPCIHGESPQNATLFGPTGTGKTCIAKFTVDRLHEELLEVDSQYVNCWQDYSRFRVLYRLLEGQGKAVDIHRQGTPTDELLERLQTHITAPFIVILDEVDQLQERDVLYDLYNLPQVTMILIANREPTLFADMDQRISSRLKTARKIKFDKYTIDELVSILEARVRWGLADDVITRPQLKRIADRAAGDARIAIGILRSAARQAQKQKGTTITTDAIDAVVPDAKNEIRRKNVEKLNTHQSILYEIIEEAEPIQPGQLNERYKDRVEEPRSERTVRKYLNKMRHYNLIEASGEGKQRQYQLYNG